VGTDEAADQLLILFDGVLAHAVTRPDSHPALRARAVAAMLLDGAHHPYG
jgi:hypothetical protein